MVTSYALVVPLKAGEGARQLVTSLGIGRPDLKLGRREGYLLIPIQEPVEPPLPDATVEVAEFTAASAPGSYKDKLHIADALRPHLPSSFDIVGDLVVIKIPSELERHGPDIGRAILAAHPNIHGVFHDAGVHGPLRVRDLVHLAGERRTETVHGEYGAKFRVDLAKAYFSPRLANEHQRVAQLVQPGETFVDATCGVGPFSILAAKRRVAKRIVALDLNPEALRLLRENLLLNRVAGLVDAVQGDAKNHLAELAPYDRTAINLPREGEEILRAAWKTIAPGGAIHYYAVVPAAKIATHGAELAARMAAATGRPGQPAESHIVHPYSPVERLLGITFNVGA